MTYANRCFDLMGDPTRREIVRRLAHAPASVASISAGLPVSRPAVSQHLKLLKEAGLVTDVPVGAQRIYRLDPRGIGAMRDVLDDHWRRALGHFKTFADNLADREKQRDLAP